MLYPISTYLLYTAFPAKLVCTESKMRLKPSSFKRWVYSSLPAALVWATWCCLLLFGCSDTCPNGLGATQRKTLAGPGEQRGTFCHGNGWKTSPHLLEYKNTLGGAWVCGLWLHVVYSSCFKDISKQMPAHLLVITQILEIAPALPVLENQGSRNGLEQLPFLQ